MNPGKTLDKLITEALAIEAQAAKEAGALGYMSRSLVQATLPHKQAKGTEFTRTNGAFTLSLMAPSKVGLPYGSIPRILIAWIATEAVKSKNRELILGDSLSKFMEQLGLGRTGGEKGDITRLKNQMQRLFSCYISCTYTDDEMATGRNLLIADDYKLWWHPKDPNQISLFESTVTLSQRFYDELINNPVPIDIRALKALKRSPMALDVYCWLTYRMSYLKRPTVIPWEALQMQFGADYSHTRNFKIAFLEQLRKVTTIYREPNVSDQENGLLLRPSPTHIPSRG
jgi:hypothetical protein